MRDTELLELNYRDAELNYLVVSRMWLEGVPLAQLPSGYPLPGGRAPAQLPSGARFLKSPELNYLAPDKVSRYFLKPNIAVSLAFGALKVSSIEYRWLV